MKTKIIMSLALSMLALSACSKKTALQFNSQNGSSTSAEPFSCQQPGSPGATDIQRLTKYELTNTLTDIFGAAFVSEVATRLGAIPNDNIVSGFDTIERRVSSPHIQAIFDLANAIATQAVSTTARQNQYAGTCFQDTVLSDTCLTNFIKSTGLKAFRRPLTTTEVSDYKTFYEANASTRLEGIKIVISRFFQSPDFIYRLEDDGDLVEPSTLELTSYELASRLSYSLWGSMPDTELMAAASDGTIKTEDGYHTQVARLLASARAKSHLKNFYSQWLKMNNAYSISFSSQFLDGISTTGLVNVIKAEAQDFVDHIIWNKKGNISDLLTSTDSFVADSRLASIYGVSPWSPGAPPVQLSATERSGILTRVSVLLSGDDENHPFRRGSTVLSRFLCYDPARPDSSTLPDGALDEPVADASLSTRDRFEIKTSPQMCMGCHSQINPFSFALENYDGLGRYRTVEHIRDPMTHEIVSDVPVNAVATYVFGSGKTATFNGGVEMSQKLAESGAADICFVRQWYRYSHAKMDTAEDNCAMKPLLADLSAEGGSILKVVEKSVTDRPFKFRRLKQ